jgi:hypothetical protein
MISVLVVATETWGLRLGIRVASIRSTGRYVKERPERVDALEGLGFEWKLRVERLVKGRPSDEQEAAGRGGGSGNSAGGSASGGPLGGGGPAPVEVAMAEADPAAVPFDSLVSGLREYLKLFGNVDVPVTFTVPDAAPWPMMFRSMPLGMCLNQIATRGAYFSRRVVGAQLTRDQAGLGSTSAADDLEAAVDAEIVAREERLAELGYQLKTKSKVEPQSMSRRFERLVDALAIYRRLFGSLDVPQHFVVPGEAPWEEDLWGLRLGSRVNAIRSQGTFVKNNPTRRELLSGMGFRWETEAGMRTKVYQGSRGPAADDVDGGAPGGGGPGTAGWAAWQAKRWAAGATGDEAENPYYRFFGDDADAAEAAELGRPHNFDDVVAALEVSRNKPPHQPFSRAGLSLKFSRKRLSLL